MCFVGEGCGGCQTSQELIGIAKCRSDKGKDEGIMDEDESSSGQFQTISLMLCARDHTRNLGLNIAGNLIDS